MQLGSTIRRFRLAGGLSQAELARRADVSASFMSRLERDTREPTLGVLRRIAEQLQVPFGILLAAALGDVAPQEPGLQAALSNLVEAARAQLLVYGAEAQQANLFRGEAEAGAAKR
ncbi:MAG TPA: helix-turn-helix transcriptional regulator [Gemmatimonadales bacterium]|nr:helix-turn-helix transcriptional regulator [Gemmatimonadales bacterium]